VNVYTPVVVLLTVEGLHNPEIPFKEFVGNTGAALPEQIGGTVLKAGVIRGLTITVNMVVSAHCPAVGVNV
jgi:hypothetical protein